MSGDVVRLSKCSIGDAEKEAVLEVLNSEYLGMGQQVRHFEKKIAEYLQTEMSVVCVSTGTSALHLACSALDLNPGDEVIIPTITYAASFQAVSGAGGTPVACDIDPETLFIDINDFQKKITPSTKAVMPVHYASNSAGMEKVYEIAEKNKLRVIEDAAQAFGCRRKGKSVGVEGDIICFSFDGIKNITCGEGGAILSADKEFIRKVQDGRLLGVEKDTEKRYEGKRSWDFDIKRQGYRYHMSNIMAAIGGTQIDRLGDFKTKRQSIARKYIDAFKTVAEVTPLRMDYDSIIPHIVVIKAENRDQLREFLESRNIQTGIHYKPNHLLSLYRTSYTLPNAEAAYHLMLTLPCHVDLTEDEQDYVIDSIRTFYEK